MILGASSFLATALIKSLKSKKKYKILCQSRRDLRKSIFFDDKNMELIDNDYFISAKEEETFNDCSYIINFINADSNVNGLTKRLDEILSYPKKIKRVGSNAKEYVLSNYMWE